MELFLAWIAFSFGVGFFASKIGRSGIAWFWASFFASPIIAAVFLVALPTPKRN